MKTMQMHFTYAREALDDPRPKDPPSMPRSPTVGAKRRKLSVITWKGPDADPETSIAEKSDLLRAYANSLDEHLRIACTPRRGDGQYFDFLASALNNEFEKGKIHTVGAIHDFYANNLKPEVIKGLGEKIRAELRVLSEEVPTWWYWLISGDGRAVYHSTDAVLTVIDLHVKLQDLCRIVLYSSRTISKSNLTFLAMLRFGELWGACVRDKINTWRLMK